MTPIELLRNLMGYGSEVDDYQLVALVFSELTEVKAELKVLTPITIVPRSFKDDITQWDK